LAAQWDASHRVAALTGRLLDLGKTPTVEVGFQYRLRPSGVDLAERGGPWLDLPLRKMTQPGDYDYQLKALQPGNDYEFRARVRHPLIELYGAEKTFHIPAGTQ
jgi:alpha-L-fucosidase